MSNADTNPNPDALIHSHKPAQQNTAQQKFQRLSADIEAEKAKLAAYQEFSRQLDTRIAAEMMPIARAKVELHTQVLQAVDATLIRGIKLSNRQHKDVVEWLLESCVTLLEDDPENTELKVIFERHEGISFEEFKAEQESLMFAATEDFISDMFGEDLMDGHEAETPEDLLHFVKAKLDEKEQQRAQFKARKPTPAQRKKQAKAEREAKEANQSVREIYRKLASALHPDREADAERRAQRTVLMQRANSAYEANDLMTLLALQREAEGLNANDARNLSEERLQIFIRVLDEQYKALKLETSQVIKKLRDQSGNQALRTPEEFTREFERTLAQEKKHQSLLADDLKHASNPVTARQFVMLMLDSIKHQRKMERPIGGRRRHG